MRYWTILGKMLCGPLDPAQLKVLPGFNLQQLVCPEDRPHQKRVNWKPASRFPDIASVIDPDHAARAASLPPSQGTMAWPQSLESVRQSFKAGVKAATVSLAPALEAITPAAFESKGTRQLFYGLSFLALVFTGLLLVSGRKPERIRFPDRSPVEKPPVPPYNPPQRSLPVLKPLER